MPFQRIVCFRFKPDATERQIQRPLDAFAQLKDQIPHIAAHTGGRTVPERDRKPDYDDAHVVTFAEREDIDRYFHHPAHQAFIEDNRAIWDAVLVLNAEID